MTIVALLRRARLLRKPHVTAKEAVKAVEAKVGEKRWARLQPVAVHEHLRKYTIETCADKVRWRTCFDVHAYTGELLREWTWPREAARSVGYRDDTSDV